MATPPLDATDRAVLAVLMRHGVTVQDRTLGRVAAAAGLDAPAARRALQGLSARQPPLVRSDIDAGLDVEFWIATYDAAEAVE